MYNNSIIFLYQEKEMALKDNPRFEEDDDGWIDTQTGRYYSEETFDNMDELSRIYNVDTPEDLEDVHSSNDNY